MTTDDKATNQSESVAANASSAVASPEPMGWELLKKAREDSGVPLESLAAVLKVPVRKLQALEAGELNQGADLTFSRALAASVCRQLRVDAEPILATWPKANPVTKKPLHGINDGAPGAATALPPVKREGAGILWAVVVLAIAGVGLWLAIEQTQQSASKRAASPQNQAVALAQESDAEPVQASPVSVTALTEAATLEQAPSAAQAVAGDARDGDTRDGDASPEAQVTPVPASPNGSALLAATAATEVNAGVSELAPIAETPAKPTVSAGVLKSAAPLSAAQIANHLLVIQAVGESWVEVTDAFGNRVFTSLMLPGDYTVLDQPSSMSVVVGNAVGVVAHSRGQPVDVQGKARGNVSRFDIR